MVKQTTQVLSAIDDVPHASIFHKRQPTSKSETGTSLGLVGYMGLVRMRTFRHYWSNRKVSETAVASSVMRRNRFELIIA